MRVIFLPVALLVAGCWTPGPGQMDPTRYPWDQAHLKQRPGAGRSYCIVSLDAGGETGIHVGGQNRVDMPCGIAPNRPNG